MKELLFDIKRFYSLGQAHHHYGVLWKTIDSYDVLLSRHETTWLKFNKLLRVGYWTLGGTTKNPTNVKNCIEVTIQNKFSWCQQLVIAIGSKKPSHYQLVCDVLWQ